jgi:hypothetical protein
MSFIKVWTDIGKETFVNLPARVIDHTGTILRIKYLSKTNIRAEGTNKKIWSYEDDIYDITDESITEYMYDEGDLGFVSIGENLYIKVEVSEEDEEDSDYEQPTDTETESEYDTDDEDEDIEEEDFTEEYQDD